MSRAPRPRTRVALVTGAAKGIGRAIARRLLDDGWHVAALDVENTALVRAFRKVGDACLPIAADVADPEACARAVAETLRAYRRLDGLVSNAGIMIREPIVELTLDGWRRVMDTNLTATFSLAKAAEAALRRSRGAIVTIASTRAHMSELHTEAYAASKGGLLALTHALALSLGHDVRVNCVSPGWIATEGYADLRKEDHAQHPAGRVGKTEDVAEIVAWLLDDTRSGFVTGAEFIVDGGMTRKMIYAE